MVLRIVEAFASKYFPTQYLVHIAIGIVTLLVLRAFSQGRTTNRERDLHARTIMLTVRSPDPPASANTDEIDFREVSLLWD